MSIQDPDPDKNLMDPKHCFKNIKTISRNNEKIPYFP